MKFVSDFLSKSDNCSLTRIRRYIIGGKIDLLSATVFCIRVTGLTDTCPQ